MPHPLCTALQSRRLRLATGRHASFAFALLLFACTGSPSGNQGAAAAGSQGVGGDASASGASAGAAALTPPSVTLPTDCQASPGHVPLQRLSRAEYGSTLGDLYAVASDPAASFPSDPVASAFDNNAELLTINPQLADLYLSTAEAVANEALQTSRAAILSCDWLALGRDACAKQIIGEQGLRLFRRPLSDAEVSAALPLFDVAEAQGEGFEGGVRLMLQALMMSPYFLYRNVPTQAPAAGGGSVPLTSFEVATRLAYFLWRSAPDVALLDAAQQGKLAGAAGLRAEFQRLLGDPRAGRFFEGFVEQWLQLPRLSVATPDAALFPSFDEALRGAMHQETRLFFEHLITQNASALDIVGAHYAFVNEPLATVYGLTGVTGSEHRRVSVDAAQRSGILTQPGLLTMTSDPDRTNIVKRGVWVASSLLCAKPPPPPDGVPELGPPMAGETTRQRLERHRQSPACSGCHNLIDPLGFGLENYDAMGRYRTSDGTGPIDNVATLPDGRTFAGAVELGAALEQDLAFKSCVTDRLLTYAIGRELASAEACVASAIGEAAVSGNAGMQDLLWAVVTADAFQRRQVTP